MPLSADSYASSSVYRPFYCWGEQGVFQARWTAELAKYGEVNSIDWTWLSADGGKTRTPLALVFCPKQNAARAVWFFQ
jgi:transposase